MPAQIYATPVPAPSRSPFNLSYEYKTTTEMGLLIPVCVKELIPGDVIDFNITTICRLQPLVSPVLHNINIHIDAFFVPYRLLWADADPDNFETFLTGGDDGTAAPTFPTWNPATKTALSLWDYLTYPVGVDPSNRRPSALPARGIQLIWNEWYRAQELQSEVTIDLTGGVDTTDYAVPKRNWAHDYYTACLLDQQRGQAPSLPITIDASAAVGGTTADNAALRLQINNSADTVATPGGTYNTDLQNALEKITATTVDIAQLRLATAQQRYLERNNLVGTRYTEYIRGHYGTDPGDARLNRPEWIGSIQTPITLSEVLQTSESNTTPQGTLAGHGINIDANHIGNYRAREWGVLIALLSIMPEPAYQQGIDREWIKETRYDFYTPEFAALSDQAVEEVELKASATTSENETIFGYIGAWDHYRSSHNKVTGYMRSGSSPDFSYWHLARYFTSRPAPNSAFVTMEGTYAGDPSMKRIFAVQDEYSFMLQVGNNIRALRPLPYIARPGGTL